MSIQSGFQDVYSVWRGGASLYPKRLTKDFAWTEAAMLAGIANGSSPLQTLLPKLARATWN